MDTLPQPYITVFTKVKWPGGLPLTTSVTCLRATSDRPETKLSNQMSELLKVAHHEWNVNDMDCIPCDMGKIPLQVVHGTCVTPYMICEL